MQRGNPFDNFLEQDISKLVTFAWKATIKLLNDISSQIFN